jgi:sigma-E factor negative regulatory protein RseA
MTMNEKQQETLSALFDGETTEFEARRLLEELSDEDLERWHQYQVISDASQNKLEGSSFSFSVVDAVAAAIADEPVPVADSPPDKPVKHAWFKPVIGFAAAASVAFVAVLGVQDPEMVNPGFVADGNVSVSQLPINSDPGLSTVSGTTSTVVLSLDEDSQTIDEQKKQDAERLEHYLDQHTQGAAFNNGRGLMPMVRSKTGE